MLVMASPVSGEEPGQKQDVAAQNARAIVKEVDASIVWTGSKITGGGHTGTLDLNESSLEFRGRELAGGSFTADMNSIKSTDLSGNSAERLINHLKSDDFFGVSTHPTSSFKITQVRPSGEPGKYTVTGDITIKSTTRPITFPVQLSWDGNRAVATARIVIDRTEFDVRYGSGRFFDGLGDRAIKDEFSLNVRIVANVATD